jgi:hypothetical protein
MSDHDQLEQLCKDYLADNLPPRRRKQVEQRLANGDPEIVSTINRLRSFQKPEQGSQKNPHLVEDDPSLLGAYITQEDEESEQQRMQTKSASSTSQQTEQSSDTDIQDASQQQSSGFTQYKNKKKWSGRLLQISGGVIILLLLVLVYYQWENVRLDREVTIQKDQITSLSDRLEKYRIRDRRSARQYEILKTIVRSELYEHISLDSDHPNWEQATMVWDRSTLRTGWLIDRAELPPQSAFYVWAADKDAQWKFAGSITRVDTDSLYTAWNNTAFNQARLLEIRLDSMTAHPSRFSHPHGELVNQIQMPR